MLLRFDPFREIDRFFDLTAPMNGWRGSMLAMDAYRDGDTFVVRLDVPGVDPDSIDVTVEKNELTVRAERHWSLDDPQLVARERPQGTFSRRLFLGEALDADRIEASYEHGVLTLRIPVAEEAKPRRIEIGRPQPALTS